MIDFIIHYWWLFLLLGVGVVILLGIVAAKAAGDESIHMHEDHDRWN